MDGWMDGQTDMTKLTVAFSNFKNMPKNSHIISHFVPKLYTHLSWSASVPVLSLDLIYLPTSDTVFVRCHVLVSIFYKPAL
jgi:hypothetical protein